MSIDYRRFLGRKDELVLAYFGGGTVIAADRGLRVAQQVAPGWWRFSVAGRVATPVEKLDPPEDVLAALPATLGHWTGARLVHAEAAEPVAFLPEDEISRFAPCRARRWYSGDLVFERVELEEEVEETVRQAFQDRRELSAVKGVPGTLRAAFALAVLAEVSARTHVPVAPLEVWRDLTDVAEGGWQRAAEVVERLRRERLRVQTVIERPGVPVPLPEEPRARASAVLAASGATLLDCRGLAGQMLEVTYRFMGERLQAIVQADTLQVLDAGICLSGHDREISLASLPSVVREGAETGQLVITCHV